MPPVFPGDIISLIAEEIYLKQSTKDILSLCLVSRDFHDASIPWLYRHVELSVKTTRKSQLIVDQIRRDKAKYVHDVYILYAECAEDEDLLWLENLIRSLPALRKLVWKYPRPVSNGLLEYLNQAKGIRNISLFYDVTSDFGKEIAPALLSKSSKLTGLDLQIHWNINSLAGNSSFPYCKTMILEAQTLKYLCLEILSEPIGVDFGICSTRDITFNENQILPAVETLILKNCLIIYDQKRSESPLQISKIQTLRLYRTFVESLNNFLMSLSLAKAELHLKEFKIMQSFSRGILSWNNWQKTLIDFLQAFSGLEELSLDGDCISSLSVPDAIACHGESLKILAIHHKDLPQYSYMTAEVIEQVCYMCPNLQEFALDLFRSVDLSGFGDSIQNSLQAFPRLRKLEIFTRLAMGYMLLYQPILDESFVQNVAGRLRSRRLERLLIQAGTNTTVDEIWRLPEEFIWENRHRVAWHINYLDVGQGYIARETAQEAYDTELMQQKECFGTRADLPWDPPREWHAFQAWNWQLMERIRLAQRPKRA